ncbi:Beta-enolase [Asimina triloba]
MSVQDYLDKHMLSRKIEDAVNAAVRAKAADPVLFISNHMKKAVPSVITKIKARQIFDSRGIPTVEVDLYTNKGVFRAAAPSGASTGMYEAVELRDGDKDKYLGKGVSKAVKNINERISEALIGMDPTLQSQIDQAMIDLDKTENKGELGANAILAVSIAACKAGAAEKEVPLYKHIADLSGKPGPVLPVPAFTVISGGKHAGNNLAVQLLIVSNASISSPIFDDSHFTNVSLASQKPNIHGGSSFDPSQEILLKLNGCIKQKRSSLEIMILPIVANSFEEAMQMGSETYHHLKAVITEKYGPTGCNVGDDGGFVPNISRHHLDEQTICAEGLDLVKEAIDRAGYKDRIKLAMDVAATDFCIDYPIVSIEEPFDKDDWEHTKIFSSLGICQACLVVGDELLMSNPKRIERATKESACNALLLKFPEAICIIQVNQIGTVTEAIEVVKLAKDAHWGVVASHRCGETEDSFISDLAVGLATGQIKAGAPCRGERLAKYNQGSERQKTPRFFALALVAFGD